MRSLARDRGRANALTNQVFNIGHSSVYNVAMPRRLVWIESQKSASFGCSECQWLFKPTGTLIGKTLYEMKKDYEAERDNQFAAHACAKLPRGINPKK
jgi:hypothetical protein